MSEPQYPECEKLKEVSKYSQQVGEFLDESNLAICEWDDDTCQWQPLRFTMEQLLCKMFGIDPVKVEQERQSILEGLRNGS